MSGGGKWNKALRELAEAIEEATMHCSTSAQSKKRVEAVLRERLEPLLDVLENSLSDPWDVHDKILKELSKWKT